MIALYHFWWSPASQRVRLALGYKGIVCENRPLAFDDDETFFALGVARSVPVLQHDDGRIWTDSVAILEQLDTLWPDEPIFSGVLPTVEWDGLLAWRKSANALFDRLYAPVMPAFRGLGDSEPAMTAYRSEVLHRFGVSIEELSNDRYAAYDQLMTVAHLRDLATRLARSRFYAGRPSAADMLLAADLFPLQLLDGVTLPLDLMYYVRRVEEICRTSLRDGLCTIG